MGGTGDRTLQDALFGRVGQEEEGDWAHILTCPRLTSGHSQCEAGSSGVSSSYHCTQHSGLPCKLTGKCCQGRLEAKWMAQPQDQTCKA